MVGTIPDIVAEFGAIVGQHQVLWDDTSRSIYGKTTLPFGTLPALIVRPGSVDEVRQVMLAAQRFKIKPHAISRGKNWGYGDACAPNDGQLIVDLRRMNRIIEINEELAYAVIEPGVSQGQLAQELRARRSRLMSDVTGAGPDASIIGNILQRGFGHTPYGDRVANSCNYQVVLPDGSVTHTGFGNLHSTPLGHVYPYGQGPDTRGLYVQSDQGIVTRMTVWLMPRPPVIAAFAFMIESDERFSAAMDQIGRLRQSGTITSVVHVANDLRVLSSQPWMATIDHPPGPLTDQTRRAYRKRAGIGRWNALGGLYGTRREVDAKMAAIRSSLRGIAKVKYLTSKKIAALQMAERVVPQWAVPERIRNLSGSIRDVYDLLCGQPTPRHLEGAFYRNRPPSGEIIDAGLIWIAPVIPCTGHDALTVATAMEEVANRHQFDLPLTISPVTPRSAICIASLSFDKNRPEVVDRAANANREIQRLLQKLGNLPYRKTSVPIA
jgi:4-cresol dehydrogenase (hydroxylating) flavoprotein subunit